MSTGRIKHFIDGHRITLIAVLCLFGLCILNAASRPERKSDNNDDDRIHLVHADELLYDKYGSGNLMGAQIVRGKVVFESAGARLKCDSAYFYQARNSFLAMGNVIYTSGDTLTFTCDSASYDAGSAMPVFKAFSKGERRVHYLKGDTLKVECRNAVYTTSKERKDEKKLEAREDVVFNHKGRLLKTDNLNYIKNSSEEKAWFFEGGRMDDGQKFLSSDWGMYYLDSKKAEFFYDVKMRNGKWYVTTDKLYYDATISTAHVVGESTITNDEDHYVVSTTDAYYDSKRDAFQLYNRSMIRNTKDHLRIEADSLVYDKSLGKGEGFGRVEYVDTLRQREMYGDYVYYDEGGDNSRAFGHAHLIKYNDKTHALERELTCDTLYANSNTGNDKAFGHTHLIDHSDGRNLEITCDTLYANDKTKQNSGFGHVHMQDHSRETDMTCDRVFTDDNNGDNNGHGNIVYVDNKNKNVMYGNYFEYNKLTGKGYATDEAWMKDYSQGDTLYVRADTMRIFTFNINTDSVYRMVHAYKKVRAYRKDVQAICDSLIGCSRDSSMTMYLNPVAWSDNRQVRGEEIQVFLADSTVRESHVKRQAFSIEKIDEENHYNQIAADSLESYFIDGKLRRTVGIGNVKVLFYPADEKSDSLMFLDNTETDTLRMYLSPERKLQKIWTNKHKSVLYPMTQIPPDKYKLPEFQWLDELRPKQWSDIFDVKVMSDDQQQHDIGKTKTPPTQSLNRKADKTMPEEAVESKEEDKEEEVTNE